MNGKSEVTEYYSGLFTGNIEKITGGSSEVINSFRSKAFERFSELGIPGKKDEAYKYTNLDLFSNTTIKPISFPEKRTSGKLRISGAMLPISTPTG